MSRLVDPDAGVSSPALASSGRSSPALTQTAGSESLSSSAAEDDEEEDEQEVDEAALRALDSELAEQMQLESGASTPRSTAGGDDLPAAATAAAAISVAIAIDPSLPMSHPQPLFPSLSAAAAAIASSTSPSSSSPSSAAASASHSPSRNSTLPRNALISLEDTHAALAYYLGRDLRADEVASLGSLLSSQGLSEGVPLGQLQEALQSLKDARDAAAAANETEEPDPLLAVARAIGAERALSHLRFLRSPSSVQRGGHPRGASYCAVAHGSLLEEAVSQLSASATATATAASASPLSSSLSASPPSPSASSSPPGSLNASLSSSLSFGGEFSLSSSMLASPELHASEREGVLGRQLQKLRKEHERLGSQFALLRAHNARTESSLTAALDELSTLRDEKAAQQVVLEEAMEELRLERLALAAARQSLIQTEEALSASQSSNASLRGQIHALKHRAAIASSAADAMNRQWAGDRRASLSVLQSAKDEAAREAFVRVQELQAEREEMRDKMAQLESMLQAERERVAQLQATAGGGHSRSSSLSGALSPSHSRRASSSISQAPLLSYLQSVSQRDAAADDGAVEKLDCLGEEEAEGETLSAAQPAAASAASFPPPPPSLEVSLVQRVEVESEQQTVARVDVDTQAADDTLPHDQPSSPQSSSQTVEAVQEASAPAPGALPTPELAQLRQELEELRVERDWWRSLAEERAATSASTPRLFDSSAHSSALHSPHSLASPASAKTDASPRNVAPSLSSPSASHASAPLSPSSGRSRRPRRGAARSADVSAREILPPPAEAVARARSYAAVTSTAASTAASAAASSLPHSPLAAQQQKQHVTLLSPHNRRGARGARGGGGDKSKQTPITSPAPVAAPPKPLLTQSSVVQLSIPPSALPAAVSQPAQALGASGQTATASSLPPPHSPAPKLRPSSSDSRSHSQWLLDAKSALSPLSQINARMGAGAANSRRTLSAEAPPTASAIFSPPLAPPELPVGMSRTAAKKAPAKARALAASESAAQEETQSASVVAASAGVNSLVIKEVEAEAEPISPQPTTPVGKKAGKKRRNKKSKSGAELGSAVASSPRVSAALRRDLLAIVSSEPSAEQIRRARELFGTQGRFHFGFGWLPCNIF